MSEASLTLSYDRKRIVLERNSLSEGLVGKYFDVYDFPDGGLEVRTKGHLLPYCVFRKDQTVSHTAIDENKRLGHALAVIKAQRDTYFTPKVKTNSQKLGYQKRVRKVYGPTTSKQPRRSLTVPAAANRTPSARKSP